MVFIYRLLHYICRLPYRVWRLTTWVLYLHPLQGRHRMLRWLAGVVLHVADITPIPLLLESFLRLLKPATKGLSEAQQLLAYQIFGSSFPVHLVQLDPDSLYAKRRPDLAFVTFHTIHYSRHLDDAILVHELMHVWQYLHDGSVYITECLWAQRWGGGYNYGGLNGLKSNTAISSFNFEQQADIVEDYYLYLQNLPLQWSDHTPEVYRALEKMTGQIRDTKYKSCFY